MTAKRKGHRKFLPKIFPIILWGKAKAPLSSILWPKGARGDPARTPKGNFAPVYPLKTRKSWFIPRLWPHKGLPSQEGWGSIEREREKD